MHFPSRDKSIAAFTCLGVISFLSFPVLLQQSGFVVPVSLTGSVFKYCGAYLAGLTSLDSLLGRAECARGSPSNFFIVLRLNCNHLTQCE